MTRVEERIKEFQAMMVAEYRETNPEDTMGLTDAEVAMMVPINQEDVLRIKREEVELLQQEIISLKESIQYDMETLNDPKTWHEALHEIRADIRYAEQQLQSCYDRLTSLEQSIGLNEEDLEDGFGR